jgi:hypothetical protein
MKKSKIIEIIIVLLLVLGALSFFMQSSISNVATEKPIPKEPEFVKEITKEAKTFGNEEALEKRIHDLQQELLDLKSEVALKDKENHRLAILTINTPPFYKAWAGIAVTNRKKYCKKHGYGLYIEHGKSDDRPPVWSKITALLQHMEEDKHEWYWALDLDALLTNGNKKASEYLDDNYDLIVNNDCNWYNAGSFFIKNSEWSKKYLKKGTLVLCSS